MDDDDAEFRGRVLRAIEDCDIEDIPHARIGYDAFEIVRAMFVALAKRDPTLIDDFSDALDARIVELECSGEPGDAERAEMVRNLTVWPLPPELRE